MMSARTPKHIAVAARATQLARNNLAVSLVEGTLNSCMPSVLSGRFMLPSARWAISGRRERPREGQRRTESYCPRTRFTAFTMASARVSTYSDRFEHALTPSHGDWTDFSSRPIAPSGCDGCGYAAAPFDHGTLQDPIPSSTAFTLPSVQKPSDPRCFKPSNTEFTNRSSSSSFIMSLNAGLCLSKFFMSVP
jgi:hypothetical protein